MGVLVQVEDNRQRVVDMDEKLGQVFNVGCRIHIRDIANTVY